MARIPDSERDIERSGMKPEVKGTKEGGKPSFESKDAFINSAKNNYKGKVTSK